MYNDYDYKSDPNYNQMMVNISCDIFLFEEGGNVEVIEVMITRKRKREWMEIDVKCK